MERDVGDSELLPLLVAHMVGLQAVSVPDEGGYEE